MGTFYQGHAPLVQDLKVTKYESNLLFSPKESEIKTMFLSNIDQVLNFDLQTLHFFSENPSFPPKKVFEMTKNALQKLLVPYYFMGGRIKVNNETGRLEIDCKNGGIGYVEASSEYKLDELGDLVYPNPSFEQLVTKKMSDNNSNNNNNNNNNGVEDHPLCIIQMTSFKCGGFAMGVQTSHAIFDGTSFKYFLQNLAALTWDKPLSVTPYNNRELLAARNPPRVVFPHPELLDLKIPIGQEGESEQNPNVFDNLSNDLDFKIFSLSANDINTLKERAKAEIENEIINNENAKKGVKVTGFNVISALVWRCKALSSSEEDKNRSSTMLFSVDIRPRLNPPLPATYTGNAVLTAHAIATCKELEESSLSRLVELVSEGGSRMNDEYARSAIDWGQIHKGFPNGEFLITSWWRLGFSEVDYPWGRPKYSCPLVHHRKDIILLFPDIDESKGGVNVLVTLPHKEMVKFQALFQKFLAN